ncbi:MAG: fatty acid desaturase [Phycisphaeraceae bacterium]|nr:MAG: fatty acid desaturase [Phycisphaeraceae bacterium]
MTPPSVAPALNPQTIDPTEGVLPLVITKVEAGQIQPVAIDGSGAIPTPEAGSLDNADHHAGLGERIATAVVVVAPVIGFAVAMVLLWGGVFNFTYLAIMVGMYLVTGFGITIGFHRYFTHKSFDTSRPMAALLGVAGSMAVQGTLLDWAATHRSHHQHSDHEDDPHSPHNHGGGIVGVLKGAWHAHVGWFLKGVQVRDRKYVVDLVKDPMVRRISALFPLWALLGLIIPAIIGGLVMMSWNGALLGFLWGGLVRVFLVHHVTWSVNSVCHLWGSRPFRSHDHSRNNPIFGVLALGEGWHNNHHAFPASARHGLRWWQFDASYIVIRTMAALGLASNVRVPSRERMESKRAA